MLTKNKQLGCVPEHRSRNLAMSGGKQQRPMNKIAPDIVSDQKGDLDAISFGKNVKKEWPVSLRKE